MLRECFPPYMYLCQVADHCPKAAATYLTLWREKGKDYSITYEKKKIRGNLLVSPTKFRNDILMLAREGLLEMQENPSFITITLAGSEEGEADLCLL